MTPVTRTKVYYFGCVGRAGHFLWVPGPGWAPMGATTPWGESPDGTLAPHPNPRCEFNRKHYGCHCQQIQGEAQLHHKDGWTAIGFWDRSVDGRGGCNSNFIAEGIYTFDEMTKIAATYFPNVWSRFQFAIKEVKS